MLLSVVIPTYNRSEILKECLEALEKQTLSTEKFEVVVVDDGSTDNTKKIVTSFLEKFSHFTYLSQRNQGQGIARNFGIKRAKGDIIVLIGDDIIPTSTFLEEHLRMHLRHSQTNEAVLGFTAWHPKLKINQFMNWMTNGSVILGRFGGHQFAYEKLHGKEQADFNFFYTSNISLKKTLLQKYPFDPAFAGYGWEDIELGYRLFKKENLLLYYHPAAIAYHDHFMTEDDLPRRMRAIGRSAWIFHRKYPELKKIPSSLKYFVFWVISREFFCQLFKIFNKNLYYYFLSKRFFLEGLQEGEKDFQKFSLSGKIKVKKV